MIIMKIIMITIITIITIIILMAMAQLQAATGPQRVMVNKD